MNVRDWRDACPTAWFCLNSHGLLLFPGFRAIFQNLAGLAFEMGANGFQRGKTDGPGLAGLEDGMILRRDVHGFRQVIQPHFPLGENHVEIDDDGHIKRKEEG